MKSFSEFNIIRNNKGFRGDKIKTDRIINREIVVHDFKIEDSKKEAGGKCLHLQISINDTYHVVFTGGKLLIEDIQKVPAEGLPFKTTIIKENDWLKFT